MVAREIDSPALWMPPLFTLPVPRVRAKGDVSAGVLGRSAFGFLFSRLPFWCLFATSRLPSSVSSSARSEHGSCGLVTMDPRHRRSSGYQLLACATNGNLQHRPITTDAKMPKRHKLLRASGHASALATTEASLPRAARAGWCSTSPHSRHLYQVPTRLAEARSAAPVRAGLARRRVEFDGAEFDRDCDRASVVPTEIGKAIRKLLQRRALCQNEESARSSNTAVTRHSLKRCSWVLCMALSSR